MGGGTLFRAEETSFFKVKIRGNFCCTFSSHSRSNIFDLNLLGFFFENSLNYSLQAEIFYLLETNVIRNL